MTPPEKPFDTYKWRWLSVQPTEGLLQAPVYLGVLRALQRFEGEKFSSSDLRDKLQVVQDETKTNVKLARSKLERNLFRNSGQYWKGTGLIEPLTGEIQLTNLGHKVASSTITHDEFTALMIRNTVLPNPIVYQNEEMQKWNNARLRIKPFELILSLMASLGKEYGTHEARLSPDELIQIVIPLAGVKASLELMTSTIRKSRLKKLDVSKWPNCAPEANDRRLAREFLLFLHNFEICRADDKAGYQQRFFLEDLQLDFVDSSAVSFLEDSSKTENEIEALKTSIFPAIIERRRVAAKVLDRSGQGKFRKDVLDAADGVCLITGENTPDVLEAAHIVPVSHGGRDAVGNGFCLRMDVHRLYDSGKLRILSDGNIVLGDQIKSAVSYSMLPEQITIPEPVTLSNVEWRCKYL